MTETSGSVHTPTHPYQHLENQEKLVVQTPRGNDKEEASYLESQQQGPKQKRCLFWFMSKKARIWTIVGSIVVVIAVVLMIIFLAVIPHMFQANADKVSLTMNYLDMITVVSDAEVGVKFSVQAYYGGSIKSRTDEATATLSYNGEDFGTLVIPALTLRKKTSFEVAANETLTITNPTVFQNLATDAVTKESIDLVLDASIKAHSHGFSKSGLSFKRTLNVKGFNQFSNPKTEINYMNITSCTDGLTIVLNASIANVAQLGLNGIGALNLSMYYDQDYLGYLISADAATGVPRGTANQLFNAVIPNTTASMAAVTEMIGGVIANNAQFYITGDSDYTTDLTLLKPALKKLNMSVPYTDGLSKVGLGNCAATLLALAT